MLEAGSGTKFQLLLFFNIVGPLLGSNKELGGTSLSVICELTHIATCNTSTPENFIKICDEVYDTYSNAKCEVSNNASLQFLMTLKVFSDTFCIVKCAMF